MTSRTNEPPVDSVQVQVFRREDQDRGAVPLLSIPITEKGITYRDLFIRSVPDGPDDDIAGYDITVDGQDVLMSDAFLDKSVTPGAVVQFRQAPSVCFVLNHNGGNGSGRVSVPRGTTVRQYLDTVMSEADQDDSFIRHNRKALSGNPVLADNDVLSVTPRHIAGAGMFGDTAITKAILTDTGINDPEEEPGDTIMKRRNSLALRELSEVCGEETLADFRALLEQQEGVLPFAEAFVVSRHDVLSEDNPMYCPGVGISPRQIAVDYQQEAHVVVRLEGVSLTDYAGRNVYFGGFDLLFYTSSGELAWDLYANVTTVFYDEENPHPHLVRMDCDQQLFRLCSGANDPLLRAALQQGRVLDLVTIVYSLLDTYGQYSNYQSLSYYAQGVQDGKSIDTSCDDEDNNPVCQECGLECYEDDDTTRYQDGYWLHADCCRHIHPHAGGGITATIPGYRDCPICGYYADGSRFRNGVCISCAILATKNQARTDGIHQCLFSLREVPYAELHWVDVHFAVDPDVIQGLQDGNVDCMLEIEDYQRTRTVSFRPGQVHSSLAVHPSAVRPPDAIRPTHACPSCHATYPDRLDDSDRCELTLQRGCDACLVTIHPDQYQIRLNRDISTAAWHGLVRHYLMCYLPISFNDRVRFDFSLLGRCQSLNRYSQALALLLVKVRSAFRSDHTCHAWHATGWGPHDYREMVRRFNAVRSLYSSDADLQSADSVPFFVMIQSVPSDGQTA